MTAYRRAIELGAHMIEADVRLTRDAVAVMMHDRTLDRTTSGRGAVSDIYVSDLRRLDAGSWFASEFRRERVPLLEELIDLAAAAGVALCLEAKMTSDELRGADDVAQIVADTIIGRGRADFDVVASFDHQALRRVRELHSTVSIAPDRLPERGRLDPAALVEQAQAIGGEIIQHHHADLDAQTVEACHAAGLAVWAWPVNMPRDIARAHRLGVDGLMGDDVAALAAAVR